MCFTIAGVVDGKCWSGIDFLSDAVRFLWHANVLHAQNVTYDYNKQKYKKKKQIFIELKHFINETKLYKTRQQILN